MKLAWVALFAVAMFACRPVDDLREPPPTAAEDLRASDESQEGESDDELRNAEETDDPISDVEDDEEPADDEEPEEEDGMTGGE